VAALGDVEVEDTARVSAAAVKDVEAVASSARSSREEVAKVAAHLRRQR
jgi:hypothetical protein